MLRSAQSYRLVRAALALLALALCPALWGCAGHEARIDRTLDALDLGQAEAAVAALNDELGVASAEELPATVEGDDALLVLERATVLQSLDDYQLSARDFGVADKAIDLLDLSASAADDVGRYLFSDSVGRYRAPAFEKLLINSINMMNYLARHDLGGAKVEARRLAVMQRYLAEQKNETPLLGLGSYLAGLAFEKAGSSAEALNYYEEALKVVRFESLRDPLRVLTGGQPHAQTIDALVGGAGPLDAVAATGEGELVVVVGYGRVPRKLPVRLPIGVALTLVAGHISPHDQEMALALAAKGLVTWVNFPRLGKSRGPYAPPTVVIDGRPTAVELAVDVERELRKEWERNEGTLVLSAITRLLTRAAAGELVQAGVGATGGGKRDNAAGVLGLLAGLATTATLAAADTPDTRGWSTLPAVVAVSRLRLPAGKHRVRVSARGLTKDYAVDLRAGDWAFVCMSALL